MRKSRWRKSSRSQGNGGSCVELRVNDEDFQVRDSKLGNASPVFDLAPSDLEGLLRAAQC
jgi:hypothetical protein